MTLRSVISVVPSELAMEGAGFAVRRPFPTSSLDHIDPFLLLDHVGPADLPAGGGHGAPDHPHRGFETVSYILEGALRHEDSTGDGGVLYAGDVQWMTAGRGIVHSEIPDPEFYRHSGRVHGLQLWVNLPSRAKSVPPRYQHIPAANIPRLSEPGVELRVIAGSLAGITGPVSTHTPITYAHLRLERGAGLGVSEAASRTALLYIVTGQVNVGPQALRMGELATLEQGDTIEIHTETGSDVLLLLAEPLGEPIARLGPFVMNTQAEIVEAMTDYRAGRLGRISRSL